MKPKRLDGDRLTRFGRFFRNLVERFGKSFYEGPEPPGRYRAYAEEFARLYPQATVADWIEMSARNAETAYSSGWTRGFEWAERDLVRRDPSLDPDRAAHLAAHDYAWTGVGGLPPADPKATPRLGGPKR